MVTVKIYGNGTHIGNCPYMYMPGSKMIYFRHFFVWNQFKYAIADLHSRFDKLYLSIKVQFRHNIKVLVCIVLLINEEEALNLICTITTES